MRGGKHRGAFQDRRQGTRDSEGSHPGLHRAGSQGYRYEGVLFGFSVGAKGCAAIVNVVKQLELLLWNFIMESRREVCWGERRCTRVLQSRVSQ